MRTAINKLDEHNKAGGSYAGSKKKKDELAYTHPLDEHNCLGKVTWKTYLQVFSLWIMQFCWRKFIV